MPVAIDVFLGEVLPLLCFEPVPVEGERCRVLIVACFVFMGVRCVVTVLSVTLSTTLLPLCVVV